MKFKKVKVLALSATLVLALTACSKQENKDNMNSNPSSVEKVESNSNKSNKMDDNKAKIDELMKKQNDILASHDKQWQVAFSKADKSSAEDNKDKGYDAYLKDLVEKAKDELSKEDYELLTKDVEEIAKLEEEITKLKSGSESASNKKEDGAVSTKELKKFPTFNSKDFDGNDVTKDVFKDKKLTLVNFWFNGCAPCVGELPKLQQLNDEIEKIGGQVIGINSEAKVGDEDTIKEAKKILEKQGAKYKNITIDKDSELEKYTETIMSYPTSILVDSEGNIVGDPIVGAIDKEDKYKEVKEMIEKIIKDKM